MPVWWCAPDEQYWVIEPLVEAGLATEEIRAFLLRLAFDAVVSEDGAGIGAIVVDQPPLVRAAWVETIGRMLALPGPES
jgi:hypothetical protein